MAGVFQNDGEEGACMRPKGYYWVRFRDGGWEPAEWDSEAWQVYSFCMPGLIQAALDKKLVPKAAGKSVLKNRELTERFCCSTCS